MTKSSVHPVLQFCDSWIQTLRKFKSSYRKIKKDNWTLVYWAYSSIHIALNTPYTHIQTPFVSETNYCRRSEQVDKIPRCLNLCCFHYVVFSWKRERWFIKYFLDISLCFFMSDKLINPCLKFGWGTWYTHGECS